MFVGMRIGVVHALCGDRCCRTIERWEEELVAYLPCGGSCKPVYLPHHVQQRQELFVLIVKAVPEDNRVNDIGDGFAQVVGRVNGLS